MTRILKLRQGAHSCGPRHRSPFFHTFRGVWGIKNFGGGKSLEGRDIFELFDQDGAVDPSKTRGDREANVYLFLSRFVGDIV